MLGRHWYVNGRYEEAIRLFGDVGEGSKRYVEAQLFMGISHLQRRKREPALDAFQRAARAIDASAAPPPEKERLRSLAALMIARMNYSTSFRLGITGPSKSPPRKGISPRK